MHTECAGCKDNRVLSLLVCKGILPNTSPRDLNTHLHMRTKATTEVTAVLIPVTLPASLEPAPPLSWPKAAVIPDSWPCVTGRWLRSLQPLHPGLGYLLIQV